VSNRRDFKAGRSCGHAADPGALLQLSHIINSFKDCGYELLLMPWLSITNERTVKDGFGARRKINRELEELNGWEMLRRSSNHSV